MTSTREALQSVIARLVEVIDQLPTDPSAPRTWGTLDAVDTDVDRVTGDYVGMRRELARGELSGSGWFQRVLDEPFRSWTELPVAETKYVKNIMETS